MRLKADVKEKEGKDRQTERQTERERERQRERDREREREEQTDRQTDRRRPTWLSTEARVDDQLTPSSPVH